MSKVLTFDESADSEKSSDANTAVRPSLTARQSLIRRQSELRNSAIRASLRLSAKLSVAESVQKEDEDVGAKKSIESLPFDGCYDVRFDKYYPDTIKIKMSETDYYPLFGLGSSIAHSEYAKEEAAADRNWLHNKKMSATTETSSQTPIVRFSHMGTNLSLIETFDVSTFVNNEMLYDAFHKQDDTSTSNWGMPMVLNRLMASNEEHPLQMNIDELPLDPLRRDINFTYTCKILRVMSDPILSDAEVRDIARNHMNPSIYAAGITVNAQHGPKGMVGFFSLKNTVLIERVQRLTPPVLCLRFSKSSPNLLAVGCQDGSVSVIDVSSSETKVLHFEPSVSLHLVRLVQWWKMEGSEALVFSVGCELRLTKRPFLAPERMLMMALVHQDTERLQNMDVPLTTGPAITSMLRVLSSPDQYILAASDGFLRLCSVHSRLEYLQIFPAHNGVVSAVRAVPHNFKLFVTSGSDGMVKLWALGVTQPLMTLLTNSSVGELVDVVWSPLHATIVVAASPSEIHIWDIRRRIHSPMSTFKTKYNFLNIQFSLSGEYLLLGTDKGNILFVGMEEMPFPETYKQQALTRAIVRRLRLAGDEPLINKLRDLGTFKFK